MKTTGIVRYIDDLGRVVIPKEIRKACRIREGDPLEIFTDSDGSITLKPYLPYSEPWRLLEDAAELVSENDDYCQFKKAILALAKQIKNAQK